jgi:hypothetical protein
MMLCVGKKMVHDSLPDHELGRRPAGDGAGAYDLREYPPDGHASSAASRDQRRCEVLMRVVRISEGLNQRLAL